MLHQSKGINPNYAARIDRIQSIDKVEGADKLWQATIGPDNVLVDPSYKVGDLVVFFPVECTICDKLLGSMNLFEPQAAEKNSNYDEYLTVKESCGDARSLCGYFSSTGRVRAIKLRGAYSLGFVLPTESLGEVWPELKGYSYKVGTVFDSIGDEIVCKKYVPVNLKKDPKAQVGRKADKHSLDRLIPDQFHFHYDTELVKNNMDMIHPDDHLTISVKLHGTSVILSNTLCKRKLSRWEKIKKFFGRPVKEAEYGLMYSSRTVLKNRYTDQFTSDVYGDVAKMLGRFVEPSYTWYGEIVGYKTGTTTCIQKNHDYGCEPGVWRLVVYRITRTTDGGQVKELEMNDVISKIKDVRQKMLSEGFIEEAKRLDTVTVVYDGLARSMYDDLYDKDGQDLDRWRTDLLQHMSEDQSWRMEKREPLCKNKVPREGVVIRITDVPGALKLKTKAHYLMETQNLDDGVEDIEEEN